LQAGSQLANQFTAALFWQKTGTTGIHVPYKGGSAAHTDIIGGSADLSFHNLGSITNHVRSGRMKLLAVTSDKRDPTFPNVPTMTEAGVPGLEVFSWQAVVAPRGLPREVMDKLQPAVVAAIRDPAVAKKFADIGFEVVGNSSADFATFLNEELARWKGVVDAGGIKQSD